MMFDEGNMRRSFSVIVTLFVIPVVFSCGPITGKGDAEKVAESLLNERIENGGFGSNTYYSEIFWENTDNDKWGRIQRLVHKAMGNLKSYELNTWNVKTQAKTNELSGTIVNLVYDTVYVKGNGTETMTLFKPIMGEEYNIVGHRFNSPEIQKLIDKGIEQVSQADS